MQTELIGNVDTQILQENLTRIRTELENNRYRDEPPAKLIAVTKTVTAEVTNRLLTLGQTDIAENRAQLFLKKYPYLEKNFRFHWIGRLQSNKISAIIKLVSFVHSLDRLSIAQEIERRAGEAGRIIPVLLQVNVSGEAQKGGIPPEELRAFLVGLKDYQNMQVKGLMTILPKDAAEAELRSWFRQMRALFDDLKQSPAGNAEMEELSMGMSGDYRIAAQEGATMVRIGTALFTNHHSTGGSQA